MQNGKSLLYFQTNPSVGTKFFTTENTTLFFHPHKGEAYGYPYYLSDAADDADKDAEGGWKPKGGDREYETAFLNAKLHGEKADEIGEKRREGKYQDRVEEGEQNAAETASAIDAEQ